MVTLQESSTQEFLGLTADYWQAISTFVAPILAGILALILGIWLGGLRLRKELQGREARRYFLEEGLLKLSAAYEQMLGAIRLNYAMCGHLLGILRNVDRSSPVAPRPEDLPQLVPAITDATAFAAIGPSSRIADFPDMGDLASRAFARLININLWFLIEIWLPIRSYYSQNGSSTVMDRAKAADELMSRATKNYSEAEEFRTLASLLADLALRTTELGLADFGDFWRIRKDKDIAAIRHQLGELLKQLAKAPSPPNANSLKSPIPQG